VAALREEMQKALSGSRAEEVEAMNARIRGMEAEFEAAKNALHDSRLVAPFNGLVAERYVENYEIVKAGQPVALFIDLSAIRVRAALPEELLLKQNEIKKATLRFPGGNEQNLFTDHLEFSQQSAPANLVWFLDAIVELPEKSPLRPGMSAFMDIEFLPDPDRTLFIIPHRSVFSHDLNSAAVFIYEPDCRCARLRTVKTGFLRSGGLEVTEGLKAGENLITNGFARLFDGCKVKINQ
jgi:RND family efflux transporter MFP subunit